MTIPITYYGRPETAQTRGICPAGYTDDVSPDTPGPSPYVCVYDSLSSDPLRPAIGVAYPFNLGSNSANFHCALIFVQFDGHVYVPEGLAGTTLGMSYLDQFGTMTLTSPNHATFRGFHGGAVPFYAVSSVTVPVCL